MMFSPSSAHIAPFCPNNGADAARQYACKYAGKPEKWYYLEGDRSGVKESEWSGIPGWKSRNHPGLFVDQDGKPPTSRKVGISLVFQAGSGFFFLDLKSIAATTNLFWA